MNRKSIYRWMMGFLIALVSISISFGPGFVVFAEGEGSFNAPPINEDFYQPKEGEKPKPHQPINGTNTQIQAKDQKQPAKQETKEDDGPGIWDVLKFMSKDVVTDTAAAIEPNIYNEARYDIITGQWENPNANGILYTSLVKVPRSLLGNLYFQDGSIGKIAIDTWDGAEKTLDAWNKYKTLREINTLQRMNESTTISIFQKAEIQKKIGSLKTVTKFAKGVGFASLGISAIDAGKNFVDAFKADNSDEAYKSIAKGVGSVGEMLIAGGQILGPTGPGVFLMGAGTVLWAGSALYTHREGIKKGVKKAINGVKSAWNKIFG
ncbi:MAG: hypothetical protein WB502_03460 [Thermoactinomyces sp.]